MRVALLEGVSARGLSQIARLERSDLGLGAAAAALKAWQEFARASDGERADRLYYGHAGCCPDPSADRETLERVVRVLPPRDARAFGVASTRWTTGSGAAKTELRGVAVVPADLSAALSVCGIDGARALAARCSSPETPDGVDYSLLRARRRRGRRRRFCP